MYPTVRYDRARAIADSQAHVHFVSCGGGVRVAAPLWDVPGSSGVLAGASFFNDTQETDAFLGFRPEGYVTEDTAIHLAMAAYVRAASSLPPGRYPVGVAITASVASLVPHRGEHRANIAVVSNQGTQTCYVTLEKGTGALPRSRDASIIEDAALGLLDAVIRHKTAEPTSGPDYATTTSVKEESYLRHLFMIRPLFMSNGRRGNHGTHRNSKLNVLMATLNPLHEGHEGQLAAVEERWGGKSLFIVTCKPIHGKTSPGVTDMLDRAAMVRASNLRTGADRDVLFSDELVLNEDVFGYYPGTNIVQGADSTLRMLEPRWYPDGDVKAMLMRIWSNRGHFFVFGRMIGDTWVSAEEACKTAEAACRPGLELFYSVPGRWDVSSTKLREKNR